MTPEIFMMIRWREHSQKVCDRRTDGQTENTICKAAWSQLKTGDMPKYCGPQNIYYPYTLKCNILYKVEVLGDFIFKDSESIYIVDFIFK